MDRYCQTLPEVNNAKTQTLSDDEVLPKIVSSSKENVEVKQSPVVKIDKKDVSAQYSEPKEKNIIMKDTSIQYSSQSNTSSISQSYDINEDILFEVNSKKKKMSWKKSEEKRFHDTTEIEDIANLSRIKGANFPSSKIGSELGEWVKHEVMQRILQKSFATTTVESKNIPENKVSDETLVKEEITQVENNVKKIDFDQVTEKPEKIKDDLYSGEISNEILNEMLSDLIDFEGRVLLQEIREQREQALKKELEVSTIKENEIKSILEKKDLELAAAKKQFEDEIVKFKTSMEKEFEKKTVDIEKNKDIEFEIKNLKLNFEKVEIEKKELIEKLNFEKMLKEKELKELEEKKKLEFEELEKRRHYEMQQYEEKKNLEIAEKKKLKNLAKLKDAKLKELQDLEIEKVEMDNKKKKKLEEEELRQANVAKEEELRRQNLEKLKAELETVEAKRKKLESELDNFLINRDKEILFASKDDLASSVFVEEGSKKSSLEESKSKINSSSSYGIDLTDMSSFSQGELLTQIFSEGEVVEKINFKDFEKLLKKKAQFPEEEKNIGASSKEKKFFEDIGEKESYYSFGEVSSEEKGVHKNISKVKVQQQVFHQENSGSGSGSGGATTSSGETSSLGEITNAELIHNFSILSTGEVSEIKRFGYILKKGSLGEINIYSEDESERLEHISLKAEEKKKKVTIKGKEKMESETQNDKSKVDIPQENVERKKDEVGKIPLVENVSNLQMIESHRKIEKQATQNLSNQLAKADEASYLNPTLESESNDNKFSAEDIVPLDSTSKIFSGERENSEIEHKRNDYNIQTKKQDDELKDSNVSDGSNFEAMSKKVEEQSEVRDKENSTEEFDKSVESEIKSLGNVAEKVLDICSSSENVSIGKYSTLSKSKSLISISSVTSSVDGDEDKKIEEMLKISSSIRKNLSHLLSSNATSTSSSSVNYEHFKLNKEANTGDSASSSLKKDVIKKSSINYLPDPKKVIELLESESLSSIISDNASKSRDDNISKVFDVETSLLDDDVSTSSKHSLYKGENKAAAAIKEDNNEKSNSSANNDDLEKSSIEESIPSRAAAFSEIEIPSKSADDRNSKSSASSIISEILQSKNSSKSSGTGSSPKYSSEVFEMNKSEGNDGEGTNKSNYSDVYETSDQ
ncbi:hypothetical protein HDU92_005968 [Lobulomyces angularis]|nr:hypothetical protein HDU92_005968 [Lobulomyces angularis]